MKKVYNLRTMPFISYVKACLNIWWEHMFTKVLGIKLSFFLLPVGVCTDILAMLAHVTNCSYVSRCQLITHWQLFKSEERKSR